MPAAAVIPAPIAYIKVVAVKKLVVEFWTGSGGPAARLALLWPGLSFWGPRPAFTSGPMVRQDFYCEKIRVFKAGICLNTLAWNNRIGLWFYFVGF